MQAPVDDRATRLIAPAAREPLLCLSIRSPTDLAEGQLVSARLGPIGSLSIGRDERADWLLADRSGGISREHCLIAFAAGAFVLEDKSANGTFVNGSSTRLRGPYRLCNGDQLCIGPYVIEVQVSGIAEALPAAASESATASHPPSEQPAPRPAPVPPAALRRGGDPAALFADAPAADLAHPAAAPVPPPVPAARPVPANTPGDEFTRLARVASPRASPPTVGVAPTPSGDPPDAAPAPASAATSASDTPADDAAAARRVRAAIARGLGLSIDDLHESDPAILGEQIGELLRLLTGELRQLVARRAAALDEPPTLHSAIGGSNPLAIMPSSEEALRILFGPPRQAFLAPREAYASSLHEVAQHWRATEAAMDTATRVLAGELAPSVIEQSAQTDKGFGQLLGARKGRYWEMYCERWSKRPALQPERPLASFLRTFAEHALDGSGGPGKTGGSEGGAGA